MVSGFVTVITYVLCVIVGGYFIGSAVADFKAERYMAFGIDIMVGIAMVLAMVMRLMYIGGV